MLFRSLSLKENEAFNKIAKKLLYGKKDKIVIDSLSVEATVFRDEVDLYPFLIAFNNYKAVIGGRHYLDQTYDYHISLTDSPLPIRLGLDVKGTPADMKYKLASCKYAKLYRPRKQGAAEKQTLELKNLISESLKANVKK